MNGEVEVFRKFDEVSSTEEFIRPSAVGDDQGLDFLGVSGSAFTGG